MMLFNNIACFVRSVFTIQGGSHFISVDLNGQDMTNIFWKLKNETGLFLFSLLMNICLAIGAIGFLWLVFGRDATPWHFFQLVYTLGVFFPVFFLAKAYFRPQYTDAEGQLGLLSYIYLEIFVAYWLYCAVVYFGSLICGFLQ